MVRADDQPIRYDKRGGVPGLHDIAVDLRVEDCRGQVKLGFEFLLPLLAQDRGHDEKDATPPLCPPLVDDDARLDGLPQANLVRQHDPARER